MSEPPRETPRDLPSDGWMIAQLRPNGLALARRNLERQGFAVLAPAIAVTRRRRDRLVTGTEPLFPGYLFVRAGEGSAPPARIGNTLGVGHLLLRPDRRPATLPPGFVAALAARCDAAGLIAPESDLAPGDRVRITQGPFVDAVTRIEGLAPGGRIAVLIGILGQEARLTLSPAQVRRES